MQVMRTVQSKELLKILNIWWEAFSFIDYRAMLLQAVESAVADTYASNHKKMPSCLQSHPARRKSRLRRMAQCFSAAYPQLMCSSYTKNIFIRCSNRLLSSAEFIRTCIFCGGDWFAYIPPNMNYSTRTRGKTCMYL